MPLKGYLALSYFDHFATSPMTPVGRLILMRTHRKEYKIIRQYLHNQQAIILEIGPGRGELAHMFRVDGFSNYTGVEPNPHMNKQLESDGFCTKSYLIPHLKESDSSYDVIILNDVFEHLNDTAEAKLFIKEAYRVLRPGGFLCIGCPDYTHWGMDFFNGDYSHSNITTVRRTQQLFVDYGLHTVTYRYFSGFVSGFMATLLSQLVRMGLFFVRAADNEQKLYKLKLTFLRRFFIIGAK